MTLVLTALFLTYIAFWAGVLWAGEFGPLRLSRRGRLSHIGVAFQAALILVGYIIPLFVVVLQEGDAASEVNRAALAIVLNCVVLPALVVIPRRLPANVRRILFKSPANQS